MIEQKREDVAIGFVAATKEKVKEFFGNYLVVILIVVSVFVLMIGGVLLIFVPDWPYIHVVFGVSSSILGAGIFGVVLKGRQFTNIFKKHIYDVVFQPQNAFENGELLLKWSLLTDAILKSSLPRSHQNASDMIKSFFLDCDEELSYHFVDLRKSYNITVRPDSTIADAIIVTKSKAVISPNQDNPILEQSIRVEGGVELESVLINGRPVQDLRGVLEADPTKRNTQRFRLPLRDYVLIDDATGDRYVEFERKIVMTQDLSDEVHYLDTLVRFAKGSQVKAKVSEGYKLVFRLTGGDGTSAVRGPVTSVPDVDGYERWEVSSPGQLNIPGQGYIIMVIPTS